MKKTSVLAGATLLLAGPAFAADLAKPVYKAPSAVAPGFTWTGCYLGADAGGAWAKQSAGTTTTGNPNTVPTPQQNVFFLEPQADTAGDLSNDGSAIGGLYVGCNYQFRSGLVLGAEADFNWTSAGGSFNGPNIAIPGGLQSGGVSMSSNTRWAASLRARLGYAVMPNVLVYGTGGGAWAATDYTGIDTFSPPPPNNVSLTNPLSTVFSNAQTGWVAGAGVEWAPWSNNWILRLEYLHYQFGGVSSTVTGKDPIGLPIATTFNFGDLKLDTVRAGISYKF